MLRNNVKTSFHEGGGPADETPAHPHVEQKDEKAQQQIDALRGGSQHAVGVHSWVSLLDLSTEIFENQPLLCPGGKWKSLATRRIVGPT